ncbi:hypothetical protein D3C79_652310 [compost metagenome]
MTEHHAFINRLYQMLALVEGLHAMEAGAQAQSGVGAVQEGNKQQAAVGLRQRCHPVVELGVVLQPPLSAEPLQVGGRGWAGFVHNVFAGFGVATINKRVVETVGDFVGNAAGNRPGAHHCVEPRFVV